MTKSILFYALLLIILTILTYPLLNNTFLRKKKETASNDMPSARRVLIEGIGSDNANSFYGVSLWNGWPY